jgi:hypothetical protein
MNGINSGLSKSGLQYYRIKYSVTSLLIDLKDLKFAIET